MTKRLLRINELIKEELIKIIHQDYAEEFGIICINRVDTSPDFSNAKIWISILDDNDSHKLKKIETRNKYFRHLLLKKLDLRIIPQLIFIKDTSGEDIINTQKIFEKMKK